MRLNLNNPDYQLELTEESYSFYILGIWKGPDGWYIGTDSGCSCPSPFESYTQDELTGPLTFAQMMEEAENLRQDSARNAPYMAKEWDEAVVLMTAASAEGFPGPVQWYSSRS